MSGVVQFRELGNFGRFGNQLFQFCFAKAFARKYDSELQLPKDWIGRRIFKGLEDVPIIKNPLPKTKLDEIPNKTNVDLFGYYQFADAYNFYSLSDIKKWLQFKDEWIEIFPKIKDYYVACHLRRGDYEKFSHIYCTISEKSYFQAVSVYGYSPLDIVWVSAEKPRVVKDCPFEFLPDFFTLMQADVLFRANSVFSLWASILGDVETYSPIVDNITGKDVFVRFEYGNHHKVVSDYKGASPRTPSCFLFKP